MDRLTTQSRAGTRIDLVPVGFQESHLAFLYGLLRERLDEPTRNISHKKLPSLAEHAAFVRSDPYAAWYLIEVEGTPVGAIYLSKLREIGIHIRRKWRAKGYGKAAVLALMEQYPGKFLANINPANAESTRFFQSLGFVHVQNTFAR